MRSSQGDEESISGIPDIGVYVPDPSDEVTVSEGSEGTLGTTAEAPPRGTLEGRVLDSRGHPIADVIVMIAEGPSHKDIGAVTDESGRYRIDELTGGSYRVMANSEGHGQKTLTVVVSRGRISKLDFVLP